MLNNEGIPTLHDSNAYTPSCVIRINYNADIFIHAVQLQTAHPFRSASLATESRSTELCSRRRKYVTYLFSSLRLASALNERKPMAIAAEVDSSCTRDVNKSHSRSIAPTAARASGTPLHACSQRDLHYQMNCETISADRACVLLS